MYTVRIALVTLLINDTITTSQFEGLIRVATNLEKPGILREFTEPGKLVEFSGNSVQPRRKIITNKK